MSILYSKKVIAATILFIILVFGAFLRFYNLGSQSYWMDEGYTANAVLATTQNGTEHFSAILDSGGLYSCPLYCSPTAVIAKTFGETAFSYRLLSAFCGVLFILVIYLFAKIFFKKESVALLSAFFVSFSYWQIAWSRQARWYTELELFLWLALLFFYLFINKSPLSRGVAAPRGRGVLFLALSILFTILAVIIHRLAYLLPIIMLAWYLIPFVIPAQAGIQLNQTFFKKTIIAILASIAILALAEYGFSLHFIAHALGHIEFHYNLPYYLSFILRNYWPFIILAIYGYFSAPNTISAVIPAPASARVGSAGIHFSNKRKIILLALPFLIYLFFLSFLTQIVHYRYLFQTTAAFYLIAAAVIIPLSRGVPEGRGVLRLIPRALLIIVIIISFFLSGQGVLFPKYFYTLEADDPSTMNRPYYAYTPQPDFNAAYASIKQNIKSDEIVISSHPHFNKIFLNQPGYWIKYNYLGIEDTPNTITDNKEYYVGAEVINNLEELKKITAQKHGYIIFDYMSTDGRIDPQIINYIQTNSPLFFYNEINSYSQIWVYHF
jgi:4-amino-4-deoxy-L-arabinose transferase-like glycosyltransferase